VLKGQNYRVTKDADLLGFGPANAEHLTSIFKELCQSDSEDVDGIELMYESKEMAREELDEAQKEML
jgi:hypothetical protein